MTLVEVPDGTLLTYKVDAQIGGKLAQIGQRLIASTTKKLADQFFERFAQIVNGTEGALDGQHTRS